jgi:hypothetical protein
MANPLKLGGDMKKNIFVIGPDPFNMKQLTSLRKAGRYAFHPLLSHGEVKNKDRYDLPQLLEKAGRILDQFSGSIDAIVSYWDFPVSSMLPLLRRRCGLTTPALASVAKCEHKYWSRLEQRQAVPECTPRFNPVDPFKDPHGQIDLDFPFWIKPVKSLRSHLAFRVGNPKELEAGLRLIRKGISRIAAPFNHFLSHIKLPAELGGVDGSYCVAEALTGGRQCTLEGYVFRGKIRVYGIVDSYRLPNRTTFTRYEYPSTLPRRVRHRMHEAARRFISHIGFDNSPFNMEFFYDKRRDKISILEVNPRQSQSHGKLFEKVAGASNHEVMVDIALGKEPAFPSRGGEFRRAAKFFFRQKQDAVVHEVPDENRLARIRQEVPGADIEIHVKKGTRLSSLYDQDSYSYEIANIYIGANSQQEIFRKHSRCLELLNFRFSEKPARDRAVSTEMPLDSPRPHAEGARP